MISRRRFLQSSVSLALVPLVPRVARSATVRIRPSWEVFCAGPTFASFCRAVQAMKAFKNPADPNSWPYWVTVHQQSCPHAKPYFLAWHRGFIYRFEERLRLVSGDPNLVLPYWNYYASPQVPAAFLDPSLALYKGDRTGSDVSSGLSLDAFADTINLFQRGKPNSFEAVIEPRPHNKIHNLVGGTMASIRDSPRDPLFWVHHANIDRLWAAWSKAGNGRHQPIDTNTYWSGSFTYGTAVDPVPRVWTTTTSAYLGYKYDDETMPATLPTAPAGVSALAMSEALPALPASVQTAPMGVPRPLVLDERSVSVDVPLTEQDAARLRGIMLEPAAAAAKTEADGPVRVVLDGVHLTDLGKKGGYFYNVYVNLPGRGAAGAPARAYLIGSIGAFEITVAQMQGSMKSMGMNDMQGMDMSKATSQGAARLVFPATDALRRIWPTHLDRLTISFVRVNGSRHPAQGEVIRIKAFSVEADPGN